MPEQEAASTISARGLTRRFGTHIAVNDITFELRRGEVLGFLGPNGAGKTTTMHMLTGNLAPSRGEISICGIDLLEEPAAAKARIGYLPEVEAICDRVQIMHHGNLVYSDTIAALKQFESGANVLVGLRRPPLLAELAAVPGVAAAECVKPTLYRVQFAAGEDSTDALVKQAAARDWGLYQLKPAQTTLEDVFVNLTRREETN